MGKNLEGRVEGREDCIRMAQKHYYKFKICSFEYNLGFESDKSMSGRLIFYSN